MKERAIVKNGTGLSEQGQKMDKTKLTATQSLLLHEVFLHLVKYPRIHFNDFTQFCENILSPDELCTYA
jgi:hypothetical protein